MLLEVAAGTGLVALALAAAVPGRGPGRERTALALAAAALAFAALAALTRSAHAGVAVPDPLTTMGPACFALQAGLGLSALVAAGALILRAAPLRAAGAALLAGAGTGLMAEGVYHLHCPITDLRHVLVWHGGAVAALALVGLLAGRAFERGARARMEARLPGRAR